MAKLTTNERKRLPKSDFAEPGKRKYPVPDKAHARNALARVAQHGTPAEKKAVRAKVKKEFPGIGSGKAQKMTRAKKGTMHHGAHTAIGSHEGYTILGKKKR